jgi:hypothetical protein
MSNFPHGYNTQSARLQPTREEMIEILGQTEINLHIHNVNQFIS